jgi:hypothetical protein
LNCSQARTLLSAYRELKQTHSDTTELDAHLEQCAACRAVLSQSNFVGEQLRALPTIEPHPQAYTHLMQALAHEHAQYMQRASSTPVAPPAFLKPYLKEQPDKAAATDPLTVFSTAETGPLPILRSKRRIPSLNQYAIIGLAAAVLLIFMTGGLASLLLLANHEGGASIARTGGASIESPAQVTISTYRTTTPYTQVVSAIGSRQFVYYTAYDEHTAQWTLEQLDMTTATSTPLLTTNNNSSLVLLGSSQNWLVWLQLDAPTSVQRLHLHTRGTQVRTWKLEALPLGAVSIVQPLTILSGTFNEGNVPSWVHTPIQGIWFLQRDTLLVAMLDSEGISHLLSLHLPSLLTTKEVTIEIASATNGHILTSPTANSNGTDIFWDEEWQTSDNSLHGNIWLQQITSAPRPTHGRWGPETVTLKGLYRSDSMSFQPQVVNNTLFFLSTDSSNANGLSGPANNVGTPSTAAPTGTPGLSSSNATPTVASTNIPASNNVIPREDASIYTPQIDALVQGTLFKQSLSDGLPPTPLTTDGPASALQSGASFLLWQSNKGYEMYDVASDQPVKVGPTTGNAAFLSVNGTTAVWIASTNGSTLNATPANTVDFSIFNWPTN